MNNAQLHGCPLEGWACFHCGEVFTTVGAAAEHFGSTPDRKPACQIKLGDERGLVMALRKAEDERDAAIEDAEEWEQLAYRFQAERDALAAHVGHQHEWLARAERKLTAYVGICSGDKELTDTILPMARQTLETSPITSLARLKAQWQAEALSALRLEDCATLQDVLERKHEAINELRRQAEEGPHAEGNEAGQANRES